MFVDHSPPGECIFCKLVKGEIPSAKVYEDDLTIAFMDIGQATRGHVLVASKRHAVNLLELTPEEAGAVMQTAQRVAAAVNKAFDPDGINIFQANGAPGADGVSLSPACAAALRGRWPVRGLESRGAGLCSAGRVGGAHQGRVGLKQATDKKELPALDIHAFR
jgi:hypothetical protein